LLNQGRRSRSFSIKDSEEAAEAESPQAKQARTPRQSSIKASAETAADTMGAQNSTQKRSPVFESPSKSHTATLYYFAGRGKSDQIRYNEVDLINACYDGHHEEHQSMLRHREIDVDWAKPDTGATPA
jgi:hypothetical protein